MRGGDLKSIFEGEIIIPYKKSSPNVRVILGMYVCPEGSVGSAVGIPADTPKIIKSL